MSMYYLHFKILKTNEDYYFPNAYYDKKKSIEELKEKYEDLEEKDIHYCGSILT